jgi:catechol 2,3-dioxygenase-like lactoylglutathione lyase family enzyme
MKLNHLNLTVTNLPAAAEFLEKYFGLRKMGEAPGMAFLSDADADDAGFVLTLMKAGTTTSVSYPKTFHIGFFVESAKTVDETYRRLKEDGFDAPAPTRNNHAYGFYVKAPGGFTVELGA